MKFINNACVCTEGYYLSNGNCLRCPLHCRNCSSETSCNNSSYNRDSSGKCVPGFFDDG